MKRVYHKPKAVHVDFHYDEQVAASSGGGNSGVALFGDPQHIGRCQQSDAETCTYFWNIESQPCEAYPRFIP